MAACSAASASRRYWRSGHGHDEGPAAARVPRGHAGDVVRPAARPLPQWTDHVERVKETIALGRELIEATVPPEVIADLSCGDAAIPRALADDVPDGPPDSRRPRPRLRGHRPGRADDLAAGSRADLFICCETIEHLDDPDTVLAMIREQGGARCCCPPRCPSSTPATRSTTGPGTRTPSGSCWSGPAGPRCCTGRSAAKSSTARAVSIWSYQLWGCT